MATATTTPTQDLDEAALAIASARGKIGATAAPKQHRRCAWIGANGDPNGMGYPAFIAAAPSGYFDVIHPDWYAINADNSVRTITGVNHPGVVKAAKDNNVQLWPLVAGVENAPALRAMMSDPAQRKFHVGVLVALAVKQGYDGLEIDYEHLQQPGDKVVFTLFARELAAAMRNAGKLVSFAVNLLWRGNSDNAADYPQLLADGGPDVLHLMGYDFHNPDSGDGHAGPVAPQGWIDDGCKFAASTGKASKCLLGLPNYGFGSAMALADHIRTAGSGYPTASKHMATCPFAETPATKAAGQLEPHYGNVWFDDAASLEAKVQIAKKYGLGGITYWTVGGEPPGFFDMVRRYY